MHFGFELRFLYSYKFKKNAIITGCICIQNNDRNNILNIFALNEFLKTSVEINFVTSVYYLTTFEQDCSDVNADLKFLAKENLPFSMISFNLVYISYQCI